MRAHSLSAAVQHRPRLALLLIPTLESVIAARWSLRETTDQTRKIRWWQCRHMAGGFRGRRNSTITCRNRACVRQNQSRLEVPACSGSRRRNGPSQSGALFPNLLEPISRHRRGESRTRAAEYGEAAWRERDLRIATALPAPVVAALSESVHEVALLSNGRTAAAVYSGAGIPASFTSRALRRIAAKRPVRPPCIGATRAEKASRCDADAVAPGEAKPRESPAPEIRLREGGFEMPAEVRNQIVQLFGADTIVSGPTSPSRAIAVHPVEQGLSCQRYYRCSRAAQSEGRMGHRRTRWDRDRKARLDHARASDIRTTRQSSDCFREPCNSASDWTRCRTAPFASSRKIAPSSKRFWLERITK